jgi:hypothetical protein
MWTAAGPPADRHDSTPTETARIAELTVPVAVELRSADLVALDDDDDEKPANVKSEPKPKSKLLKKGRADEPSRSDAKNRRSRIEIDLSELEKVLGADSELMKSLEKIGPEIEKEIKEKLGPEFEAKMKEMAEKLAKKLESQFGPDSHFEQHWKELAEHVARKFESQERNLTNPSADTLKRKESDEKAAKVKLAEKLKAEANKANAPLPRAKRADRASRAQKIEELEEKIGQLMEELKKLKASGDEGSGDSPTPRKY